MKISNSLLGLGAKIKEGNEAKLLMMTFAHRYFYLFYDTEVQAQAYVPQACSQ
jgi:hypothetical protein